MIYLEQNNEMYNNDIRAMLQAFFDNEKVVTKKDGTRISLSVRYGNDEVNYEFADQDGYRDSAQISVAYQN